MSDSKYNLWEIAYSLNCTKPEECAKTDPVLADRLNDIEDILDIHYYLCFGNLHELIPCTKTKINEILSGHDYNSGEWWLVEKFDNWIDDNTKKILIDKWIQNDNIGADDICMADNIAYDTDTNLKILQKLLSIYKKKKSSIIIQKIEKIFKGMDSSRINEACAVLEKSTPAVSVAFLGRQDINEKYTLIGIKSLSKLSRQRNLDVKIDLEMLGNLGPKARLDAMKQLLGMFDKYYQFVVKNDSPKYHNSYRYEYMKKKLKSKYKDYQMPFTKMPNREDIEKFLFPCSLKYNKEVVLLIKRFEELLNLEGGI
jgi:hypothetical protein